MLVFIVKTLMSTFRTRPNLSDLQFRQIPGTELNLSGRTTFTEISELNFLWEPINEPNDKDPFVRTDSDGRVYLEYVDFDGMGTSFAWSEVVVPYNTPTELYDLTELTNTPLTSNYMKIVALFGFLNENPEGKKISMGATVISEFIIHKDSKSNFLSSEIKSQHAGVYCKYTYGYANPPTDVGFVSAGDILIYMNGSKIVVRQKLGNGEMSDNEYYEGISPFANTSSVNLKCNYRIELREMSLT